MKRRKKFVKIKFYKKSLPKNTLNVTEPCQQRKKIGDIRGNKIFLLVEARAAAPLKIRIN